MLWEGKPTPDVVATLATMGIRSIVFDPCANVPDHGDFLRVMRQNIENLRAAFH